MKKWMLVLALSSLNVGPAVAQVEATPVFWKKKQVEAPQRTPKPKVFRWLLKGSYSVCLSGCSEAEDAARAESYQFSRLLEGAITKIRDTSFYDCRQGQSVYSDSYTLGRGPHYLDPAQFDFDEVRLGEGTSPALTFQGQKQRLEIDTDASGSNVINLRFSRGEFRPYNIGTLKDPREISTFDVISSFKCSVRPAK